MHHLKDSGLTHGLFVRDSVHWHISCPRPSTGYACMPRSNYTQLTLVEAPRFVAAQMHEDFN